MEPVRAPALIDRYDSGEVLDRTLRGLHAWLRTPLVVRELLTSDRLPDLARPLPRGQQSAAQVLAAEGLNARQQLALDVALRTRDYALVQGPPGTGKTHLIAAMVRALTARGERVLLSAWTNQAVDNLLHALRAQDFHAFARLGSPRTMDPGLLDYALAPEGMEADDIARRLHEVPVLAATVSGLADPRITAENVRRDVLILDEAAQLSVAASVGALRLARRFILVGDDQQLPPVVQSEDAAEALSVSPFEMLRPNAQAAGTLVELWEQYRMHHSIAAWPSEAFYEDKLLAHPSVAARGICLRSDSAAAYAASDPRYPVVLIDTGRMTAGESLLAAAAATTLLRAGLDPGHLGVIAPFRAQVAAIRRLLEREPLAGGCVVDTVDRFQGGQREAMIVCLGLERLARRGADFVGDPRRLNVAFTRARAKLIVIGDLSGPHGLTTLDGFVQHCRERGVPILTEMSQIPVLG